MVEAIGRENRREYAHTLLACAGRQNRPFMLISGFGESNIKSRIIAVMSEKKFKRSVSAGAAVLIIAAAAVFGTGKVIRPQMTDKGLVPTEEGWKNIQTFTGSNGETATVTLDLSRSYGEFSPDNYYCFTLSVDSEDYTVVSPRAEFTVNGAESFRALPDGERRENEPQITYKADFDKETNAIEMAADFGNSISQTVDAVITYKLKKGIFSAGTYTMNVSYDNTYLGGKNFTGMLVGLNGRIEPEGFHAEVNGGGYLISCTDGSTDLSISFNDHEDGALVCMGDLARKLDFFDPYQVNIKSVDVTGDGVNDLVLTTHITGTGVVENHLNIIDGALLCEIPVDTNMTAEMIKGYTQAVLFDYKWYPEIDGAELSGNLSSRRLTYDEIFCGNDPHIMGQLFSDANANFNYPNNDVRIFGGMALSTENGGINGTVTYGLVQDENEFSEIYKAEVSFRYDNGSFKPCNVYFSNPDLKLSRNTTAQYTENSAARATPAAG